MGPEALIEAATCLLERSGGQFRFLQKTDRIFAPTAPGCCGCAEGVLTMTRKCELTGKLPLSGNNRSHAENKTRRKFRPNLCNVTLISDALGRSFSLRISAHALKTVEHRGGLDAFLAKARDEELSDRCLKIKRDISKSKKAEPAAA